MKGDIMIPKHKEFIEAITEKKKVSLRFYSKADSGVIDLVCAPLDYGPGSGTPDGVNRYWLWDYSSNAGSHLLEMLPKQILDLSILGAEFTPAEFSIPPRPWSIPRNWVSPPAAETETRTDDKPGPNGTFVGPKQSAPPPLNLRSQTKTK